MRGNTRQRASRAKYRPARSSATVGVWGMSRIGGWVLDERLASGGQGEVCRPPHARPRQAVALKLIRPATPTARSRAAREIALLQELHHPHLVEILDHGKDEDV